MYQIFKKYINPKCQDHFNNHEAKITDYFFHRISRKIDSDFKDFIDANIFFGEY